MKKCSTKFMIGGLIIGVLTISLFSLYTTSHTGNHSDSIYASSNHSQTISHIAVNLKYHGDVNDFESWNINPALINNMNSYYVYESGTPGRYIKFAKEDLVKGQIARDKTVMPIILTVHGSKKGFAVYELMPNTSTGQYDVKQVMDGK